MITEKTHARHLVELGRIQDFFSERDVQTQLLERSEQIPLNILMVASELQQDRQAYINIMYIPIENPNVEDVQLIQLYTHLPIDFTGSMEEIAPLLVAINMNLPVGNMGFKDDNISYRYSYVVCDNELVKEDEFIDVFQLFFNSLALFIELIDEVVAGKKSVKQAIQQIKEEYEGASFD